MNCIICDSDKIKNIGALNGYIEGTVFNIFECQDCETSFSDPHISSAHTYNMIYTNSDITPGYDRYAIFRDKVLKVKNPIKYLARKEYMYFALYDFLKTNKLKKQNILDIGCGMGYLAYSLNRDGHHAVGLDISSEAITKAKNKYFIYKDKYICQDLFKINITEESDKYDFISMLEVIEHVDNPLKYIDKALSLLKSGGYLYISTPDKDYKNSKSIWISDLPEVHMTLFSKKSITNMLSVYKNTDILFLRNFFYNLFHNFMFVDKNYIYTNDSTFTADGKILFKIHKKTKRRILLEKLYIDYYFDICKMCLINLKLFIYFIFTDRYESKSGINPTMAFVIRKK